MNVSQSIHNVAKIEIDDADRLVKNTKVRHLTITDADGNKVCLSLFSEDAEALKVQLTGSLPIKV